MRVQRVFVQLSGGSRARMKQLETDTGRFKQSQCAVSSRMVKFRGKNMSHIWSLLQCWSATHALAMTSLGYTDQQTQVLICYDPSYSGRGISSSFVGFQ